ncbi:MAG: hypothetical protein AAGC95_04830 [Pseudomonadota bacterium]
MKNAYFLTLLAANILMVSSAAAHHGGDHAGENTLYFIAFMIAFVMISAFVLGKRIRSKANSISKNQHQTKTV